MPPATGRAAQPVRLLTGRIVSRYPRHRFSPDASAVAVITRNARGKLHVAHPGTLATFAVNFVRNGRHVGGHQDAARDAMSPVAQKRHGVTLRSFEQIQPKSHTPDWMAMTTATRNASIPDAAAFRIDFSDWLGALRPRDRRIIRYFVRGDRTSEVAKRMGVSAARVSQLRREYEEAWRRFQGEAVV